MSERPNVTMLRNGWSIAGALLTTVAAVVFLVVFLADQLGLHTNPYLGIVFFVVLPAFFVLGLLMIPFGSARSCSSRSRAPTSSSSRSPPTAASNTWTRHSSAARCATR